MKNRVQAERERRVRESQLPASTPPVISAEQSSSEINAVRQKLSALREADPPPSQQEEAPASRASQITIELVRTKQELLDSPPSQRSALRAKVEELEQEMREWYGEAAEKIWNEATTPSRVVGRVVGAAERADEGTEQAEPSASSAGAAVSKMVKQKE